MVGFLVIILLLAMNMWPPKFLGTIFMPIAGPLWRIQDGLQDTGRGVYAFFTEKPTLLHQIELLRRENEGLRIQLLIANEQARENEMLLKLGGRTSEETYTIAAVLSRPPVSAYDTIIIDVGSSNGVEKGDIVAVGGGVTIGLVSDVAVHRSTVTLFSTPGHETQVLIGENRIAVPARGLGGGNFEIRVPKDELVEKGDSVLLPGINPKIFGVVQQIVTTTSDPFVIVYLTLPVNLYLLRFVSVLK